MPLDKDRRGGGDRDRRIHHEREGERGARRSRREEEGRDGRREDRRERRRRRRGSSEEREGGAGRERRDEPVEKPRGFRPPSWMAGSGPRPGALADNTKAGQGVPDKVKPEIYYLCKMDWTDQAAMDKRVGGLVPHVTPKSLSERFVEYNSAEAEVAEEESEEVTARRQVRHFAQLHELGVPVELLLCNLKELCDQHMIEINDPEEVVDDALPKRRNRRFSQHDRENQHAIENVWEEVPEWHKMQNAGRKLAQNPESTVLLVCLLPVDLNVAEKLREHFQQFGDISQIIPRVNFRPAARFADQGMALVQMGSNRAARQACAAPDAVCGNRFVKVFYAPEDVQQKVEKMKIAKMMEERHQQIELLNQQKAKQQQAQQAFMEHKAKFAELQALANTLKARQATVAGEERAMLDEELKHVMMQLRTVMVQQKQAMDALKAAAEQQPQQWKAPAYARGTGRNTFYAGTTAFRLPNLPPGWRRSAIYLKRAMERYGEVVACAIGKTPPQGFIRFKNRPDAERALKDMLKTKRKATWIDKDKIAAEWPTEEEMHVEEEAPAPAPTAADEPKDEDEALIEAELGLGNEEMMPAANDEENPDEKMQEG